MMLVVDRAVWQRYVMGLAGEVVVAWDDAPLRATTYHLVNEVVVAREIIHMSGQVSYQIEATENNC